MNGALSSDVKLKLSRLAREALEKAEQANGPVERREWLEAVEVALRGIESIERTEALERRRGLE